MAIIVYLIGLSHIIVCSFLILYTKETVNFLRGLYASYALRYLSVFPAAAGLLFLISATATCYPMIFRLLGLLAFCEAVVAFTDPHKLYSRMLEWYFTKISDRTNQFFGIIGVIFGTLVLTWVK